MITKVNSIEELNAHGLYIIENDETIVENHVMQILKEKQLLASDLSKLTGISRQNINAVVKNKMKPGIDFVLKVSYVLDVPVERLFALTENAWMKPYNQEKDITMFLDIRTLDIIDNATRKERMGDDELEFIELATGDILSKKDLNKKEKAFLSAKKVNALVKQLQKESKELTKIQAERIAKDELHKEFDAQYNSIFKKIGEKIEPYKISTEAVKEHENSTKIPR